MTNELVKHWRPFAAAVERYLDGIEPNLPGTGPQPSPGPQPSHGPQPARDRPPPLAPGSRPLPGGVKHQFSSIDGINGWTGKTNWSLPLPIDAVRSSGPNPHFMFRDRPSLVTQINAGDPQWDRDVVRNVSARRVEYSWSNWRFPMDREGWAGAAFLLPRSMMQNTGTSIFQLHNYPQRGVMWNLHVANGRLISDSKEFGFEFNRPMDDYDQYLDRFVRMVLHFRPSVDDDGFIRMWLDDERVLDYSGPTRLTGGEGPYFKHGLYFWGYGRFGDQAGAAMVYHDNLRIADYRGNYDLVDPGSW